MVYIENDTHDDEGLLDETVETALFVLYFKPSRTNYRYEVTVTMNLFFFLLDSFGTPTYYNSVLMWSFHGLIAVLQLLLLFLLHFRQRRCGARRDRCPPHHPMPEKTLRYVK